MLVALASRVYRRGDGERPAPLVGEEGSDGKQDQPRRCDAIRRIVGDDTVGAAHRLLEHFDGALSSLLMNAEREFDIVIVAEPAGSHSVFVPELPSVATQGETIEEARANAQEAIEGYLEVTHDDGLPIPTVHRDRVAVQAA